MMTNERIEEIQKITTLEPNEDSHAPIDLPTLKVIAGGIVDAIPGRQADILEAENLYVERGYVDDLIHMATVVGVERGLASVLETLVTMIVVLSEKGSASGNDGT